MNLKHQYACDLVRKKIGVIGALPPLLGGVSIHNERVIDLLHSNHNRVRVFDPDAKPYLPIVFRFFHKIWRSILLLGWLVFKRNDYIFYHATYKKDFLIDLIILMISSQKTLIIEHNCRHMYSRSNWFKKLYTILLKRVSKIVFIGTSTKLSYDENKIAYQDHSIESAFLAPKSTEFLATSSYNSSLNIFIKDHTPILMINAAHIMLHNNKDIYGLKDTLFMLHSLKKNYPDIGLIMAIARVNNKIYWKQIETLMHTLNIAENIYILHNNQYIWPLFKQVDLFLRPTYSDGESISVQEALYFKVPVLASDVTHRPDAVSVFKTGDRDSYSKQVEVILKERVYGANN